MMNKRRKHNLIGCLAVLLVSQQLLIAPQVVAQSIGISNNAATPNPAAMLDITSGAGSNLGLLIPRVTFAERTGNFNPMPAACQGLTVYQTDAGGFGEGLYYNTSTTTTANWVKAGASGWDVAGNNGTFSGTNMIGTTDAAGMDFRTNSAIRISVSATGNVGVGGPSPTVPLSVGGNGVAGYGTTAWVENNLHVQGNEGVAAGRGRLRLGTRSNYIGLYADPNSLGSNNDLVLGSSSGTVRVGPGGVVQKLVLPASTGFQMLDGAFTDRVLRSDASGNGTWEQLSTIMQVYTASATRTLVNSFALVPVTGLSITINLTQSSYVITRTTGNMESTANIAGDVSATITALQLNGVSLQEQGTDLVYIAPTTPFTQHWEIYHNMVLAPGVYTISVSTRSYCTPFCISKPYYAGGTTIPGITDSGNLLVRVIPL